VHIKDGQELPIENKSIGQKSKIGKWFALREGTVFQLGGSRLKVTRIYLKPDEENHPQDPFAASKQQMTPKKEVERPRLQAEQTVILAIETPVTHLWDEPKRVVVALRRGSKQRVVGAVLVEQPQTWGQVKRKIFDGLVRNSQKSYQFNQMLLLLNGVIPIPQNQDDELVYNFIETGDQFVVEINLT